MIRFSRRVARLGAHAVVSLILCSVAIAQSAPTAVPQDPPKAGYEPFRLDDSLGTPSWLRISGSTRIRYEGISGQFRAAGRLDFSDHLVFQRTTLRVDADFEPLRVTIEGIDSRAYGADNGSQLGTSAVNAADFLQAFAEVDLGQVAGGTHRLRVGRETMDLGSRRLVARNRFRNTINSFTGLDWQWQDKDSSASTRAFFLLPVQRQPGELDRQIEADTELDYADSDRRFMGIFHERPLPHRTKLELYLFVLLEEGADTTRRQLFTPGFRVVRPRKVGEIDWQAEVVYQVGESRLAAGGPDLDHFASFQHLSIGYTYACPWSPNFRFAFDMASGDDDPADAENNRFDTLFGARRFEFGPTGIYGLIARSNIVSPEFRVSVKPRENVSSFFAWRGVWLESETDTLTTAGVRDATGNSGGHVGQQLEWRVRWDVLPSSLRLEGGLAHVFHGDFQSNAPNGQNTDTTYGYLQAAWTF